MNFNLDLQHVCNAFNTTVFQVYLLLKYLRHFSLILFLLSHVVPIAKYLHRHKIQEHRHTWRQGAGRHWAGRASLLAREKKEYLTPWHDYNQKLLKHSKGSQTLPVMGAGPVLSMNSVFVTFHYSIHTAFKTANGNRCLALANHFKG